MALRKVPIIDLKMRLGEASGAAVATLLVRDACAQDNGMATFDEAGANRNDTPQAPAKPTGVYRYWCLGHCSLFTHHLPVAARRVDQSSQLTHHHAVGQHLSQNDWHFGTSTY